MIKDSKRPISRKDYLQFRIPRAEKFGQEMIKKIEKIAAARGISLNDVCIMSVAAGLPTVESKLTEIHEPAEKAA